jgi:GxxExxY protein
MTTQKDVNALSRAIIGYAIEVHKKLGPGLLERIYEKCLAHLLIQNGYTVIGQQSVPLNFKGLDLTCKLRFDLFGE